LALLLCRGRNTSKGCDVAGGHFRERLHLCGRQDCATCFDQVHAIRDCGPVFDSNPKDLVSQLGCVTPAIRAELSYGRGELGHEKFEVNRRRRIGSSPIIPFAPTADDLPQNLAGLNTYFGTLAVQRLDDGGNAEGPGLDELPAYPADIVAGRRMELPGQVFDEKSLLQRSQDRT
jgi:hypothetical protein